MVIMNFKIRSPKKNAKQELSKQGPSKNFEVQLESVTMEE